MRECTFAPAISKRSGRLMAARAGMLRSLNTSAHQQLYQDGLRRQAKQEAYATWFPDEATFRPKLVARPPRGAGGVSGGANGIGAGANGSGSSAAEAGCAAAAERLYATYERLQLKLADARAKLEGPVDPATGRRLFQPRTGRAPAFARHAPGQAVGEYLYKLQSERDEKARRRAAEEAKRADEARRARVDAGSAAIARRLQRKRFRQVFAFLDRERGAGALDLAALLEAPPACLDDLDDDVRADLEVAARLAVKHAAATPLPSPTRRGPARRQDSGASGASSFIGMPPPPGAEVARASAAGAGAGAGGGASSAPASPSAAAAAAAGAIDARSVPLDAFCRLMEEAIAARPRPRAYLAPSPPQRAAPAETFAPAIDERSRQIAARLRPRDTPAHEILHREATAISAKKAALRAAAADAALRECTFAPRLVADQALVPGGRVLREARAGVYSHPLGGGAGGAGGDDGDDALAALVAATIEAEAAERTAARQPRREQRAGAAAAAAAAQQQHQQQQQRRRQQQQQEQQPPAGSLQELAACLDGAEGIRSHPVSHAGPDAEDSAAAGPCTWGLDAQQQEQQQQQQQQQWHPQQQQQQQQQQEAAVEEEQQQQRRRHGEAAGLEQQQQQAEDGGDDEEDERAQRELERQRERQRQRLEEIEVEVEAMLAATSAAAAAAERLGGGSAGAANGGDAAAIAAAAAAAAAGGDASGSGNGGNGGNGNGGDGADHAYLSRILGLTQEAVDAMAPAMSSLGCALGANGGAGGAWGAGVDFEGEEEGEEDGSYGEQQ